MNKQIFHTRRDFLRTTLLGGALTWTVPSFIAETFTALHAQADGSLTQVATGKDNPILVVLQLAGGNDGLNTVVPFTNDFYYKARPSIAVRANTVLKLNDQLGLNPSLAGFKALYDSGNLTVINGVGYPNPNRSHFRSTEIWQTASDSNRFESEGWLGKYFDNACQGCDATVGVNIGIRTPQSFVSKQPFGVSLQNPNSYRFMSEEKGNDEELAYRQMNQEESGDGGGSVGSVGGNVHTEMKPIDFLERVSMDAQMSSDKILAIYNRVQSKAKYPQSPLGRDLQMVAKLIDGGMPTRVYYVSHGGFDTHHNQVQSQNGKLQQLGDAVKSFTEDLTAMGHFDRVLVMTFSEFGRRVSQNASEGTDHGAAAPLFIIGPKVRSGLLGSEPSLAPQDLLDGDIQYNTDFRSVYAGVLENWMKTSSTPILGRHFDPLSIV